LTHMNMLHPESPLRAKTFGKYCNHNNERTARKRDGRSMMKP
jgi:hypothetical protein